ncbi:hypothetical protein XJ44_03390 [Thermosipho affectus]|uniref:Fibronectin type III-like domain-containing protein n=1 Tax=Thermosipho affectus TaxID=660294 RepID=A0ABX3II21_9BACT|nr:hypothetical protein XJ44_03390 [Thermosipho affectus]
MEYRYYDTFGVEPLLEFGYGLSYKTFEYSNLNLEKDKEKIKVEFDVKNVGKISGKEIAQIYVKAPKGKIDKPFQELKGFHKTKLLQPGELEHVNILIPINNLASFCNVGWVVEKGEYVIRIGVSYRDIRLEGRVKI